MLDYLSEIFITMLDYLSEIFITMLDYLSELFLTMLDYLSEIFVIMLDYLSEIFVIMLDYLSEMFITMLDYLSEIFITMLDYLSEIFLTMLDYLSDLFITMLDYLSEMFITMLDYLSEIFITMLDYLSEIFITMLDYLSELFITMLDYLSEIFIIMLDYLSEIFITMLDYLSEIFVIMLDYLSEMFITMLDYLSEMFITMLDYLSEIFITMLDYLSEIFITMLDYLLEMFITMLDYLSEMFITMLDYLSEIFITMLDYLSEIFITMLDYLSEIFVIMLDYLSVSEMFITMLEIIYYEGTNHKIFITMLDYLSEIFVIMLGYLSVSEMFITMLDYLSEIFITMLDYLSEIFITMLDYLSEIFNDMLDYLSEMFITMLDYLSEIFITMLDYLSEIFITMLDYLSEIFITMLDYLSEIFIIMLDYLSEIFITMLDYLSEIFITMLDYLSEIFNNMLDYLSELFRDEGEEADSQALQLGFELALKERDAALRDKACAQEDLVEAQRRLDTLQTERDQALRSLSASKSPSLKGKTTSGSSLPSGLDVDEPHLVEESGDNVVWQIHKVTLQRVANYGFGIAVSGGYDSPHFASGDPSVAISDVLKAGPAEGKLQLNDRIISVNGISLENVSHSMAIQVLRNSGDSVHLVVRRRVVMPAALEKESPPLRVTLIKKNKKDDFGLVLGCRFFIQEVLPESLAAHDGGLKVGDTILKVNNTPLEGLSMGEVRKLIDRSKDRLQLIVSKFPHYEDRGRSSASRLRDDEGYSTFRPPHDKEDINLYRPGVRPDDQLYPGDSSPGGMFTPASPAHLDGRYGYDTDSMPHPGTFPRTQHRNEAPPSPIKEPGRAENFYSPPPRRNPDGYYSDHDLEGYRGPPPEEDIFARHPHDERYVGLRCDVGPDIRRVVFQKDRQKGLGLRLAGGNATGIFIASVQPGCRAEAQGLVEGDQIMQANDLDIVGMTREEAVAHLTGLEGKVTLVVQYRKEDYDSIMASHEAGDSFYIRTHFNYEPVGETGDHAFKVGHIFHIKDTLFRGVGGSWLAIRVGPNGEELKKGTIPNRKKAEFLASAQQENSSGRDTLPNKGRGSLFKRKSARRAKSLGKDHWEEVVFSGLITKFPPYERVVLRDPAFVRPVVLFGAIADVARDMLLKEFPDRFESPQVEKGGDNKGKTGIIRFGAIREAIDRKKHCSLDVTPHHVDRLNYAQFYPIVVLLKGDSKQAIKEVRSRWRGASATNKNPKKLQELNEKMDSLYSHLFTGIITHTMTDLWFPKLVELIQSQQRRPVWMSEKKPEEDFNDDFMFPMPNRLSIATAPDHELDLARPADDLDISPMQKKRLVRSSSDPSVNTADRVPGIPPYPAPPGYRQDLKFSPYDKGREEWEDYRQAVPPHERDGDWQMHPDDRYYPHPHHPPESWPPHYQSGPPHPYGGGHNRSSIDVYATITPSERVRKRMPDNEYPGPQDDYGPHRDRVTPGDPFSRSGPRSPHDPHMSPTQLPADHRGYTDGSSNDNDSYSRYVSSPANKHDDSKLRDKFSSLQVGGQDRNAASHDPYRFTRSTANPVVNANIDRVKLSHLTAKYRQEDRAGKGGKGGGPVSQSAASTPPSEPGQPGGRRKEPPPVPVKTYSLKEVGMDLEEGKARNYENSNRAYNYSEVHFPAQQQPPPPSSGGGDPRYPHDPNLPPPPPPHTTTDSPYEYISTRGINPRPPRRGDIPPEIPPPPRDDYAYEGASNPNPRAFSNSVYMDQREVERARMGPEPGDREPGGYTRPSGPHKTAPPAPQWATQDSPSCPTDPQDSPSVGHKTAPPAPQWAPQDSPSCPTVGPTRPPLQPHSGPHKTAPQRPTRQPLQPHSGPHKTAPPAQQRPIRQPLQPHSRPHKTAPQRPTRQPLQSHSGPHKKPLQPHRDPQDSPTETHKTGPPAPQWAPQDSPSSPTETHKTAPPAPQWATADLEIKGVSEQCPVRVVVLGFWGSLTSLMEDLQCPVGVVVLGFWGSLTSLMEDLQCPVRVVVLGFTDLPHGGPTVPSRGGSAGVLGTDDEQLRDLHNQRHRSRLKSEPLLADRAKSETRLDGRSAARWNKYKSWDSEKEGQRTFEAYKKLITPGFYNTRKNMSKSHDELREDVAGELSVEKRSRGPSGPTPAAGRGSAFDSYRRVVSGSSLPPTGRGGPGMVNNDTL
ncbi:hypothetical protein ACOMHN_022386 [Nucella lapillus]